MSHASTCSSSCVCGAAARIAVVVAALPPVTTAVARPPPVATTTLGSSDGGSGGLGVGFVADLTAATLFNKSNQNGAPIVTASAVMSQPSIRLYHGLSATIAASHPIGSFNSLR